MTTPIRQKIFLQQLSAAGRLPLTAAIKLLSEDQPDVEALEATLLYLEVEDLFRIKKTGSNKAQQLSRQVLANPQDYVLEFNSFAGGDISRSQNFEPAIDEGNAEAIDTNEFAVELKYRSDVRVIGEIDAAANLIERVRAFTQYFAAMLLAGKFEVVQTLISKAATKISAASLQQQISDIQQDYGTFDYFDHVEVMAVYAGKKAGAKCFEEMKLPKGIARDMRRGECSFHLVSVYSPNGVAIHDYFVYLAIIEEDSLLKVCDIRLDSGY